MLVGEREVEMAGFRRAMLKREAKEMEGIEEGVKVIAFADKIIVNNSKLASLHWYAWVENTVHHFHPAGQIPFEITLRRPACPAAA